MKKLFYALLFAPVLLFTSLALFSDKSSFDVFLVILGTTICWIVAFVLHFLYFREDKTVYVLVHDTMHNSFFILTTTEYLITKEWYDKVLGTSMNEEELEFLKDIYEETY